MKNRMLILFALLFSVFVLSSCDKDNTDPLIGSWRLTNMTGYNADSTTAFSMDYAYEDYNLQWGVSTQYIWMFKENGVFVNNMSDITGGEYYLHDESNKLLVLSDNIYTIKKLKNNVLILEEKHDQGTSFVVSTYERI